MSVQISFIVIGRNEAATILESLASVFRAASTAQLPSFEAIYVDSDSTDGSVSMVCERYGDVVRVVRLTGARNAGIARNVGASFAAGKILFFVDGDMEVDSTFLGRALDARHDLVHPIVTGQLPERIYDAGRRLVGQASDRGQIRKPEYRSNVGGIFLIDRALFESMGGFAPELRINEDLDLALRLARAGARTLALPYPIALHHTVEYFDWTRIISMIRDGSMLYPGAMFRRHFSNPHYLPIFVSHQRPTIVLLFSVLLGILVNPAWLAAYVAYVGAKNLRRRHVSFVQDFVGTTARSICFLAGLLAFFPRPVSAASISYTVANRSARGRRPSHPADPAFHG